MPEALLNVRHKAGYLKFIYYKFLEVRKCGKITQCTFTEPLGSELSNVVNPGEDLESLDKRK